MKHQSIKSYLSGIRFRQIQQSFGNPFANGAMPHLEYVLAGVKRVQARSGSAPRSRLPVTLDILRVLHSAWVVHNPNPDSIMLWAAACTGFFGFLRAGEFTVPSPSSYDHQVHLNLDDVAFDSHSRPSMVRLRIKQSKTDPFRQGVDVYLGTTNSAICPIQPLIGSPKPTSGPTVHPKVRNSTHSPIPGLSTTDDPTTEWDRAICLQWA